MEMLVVTWGSMTSLYCQYEACGREDMKIPEEADDTNDHDDICGLTMPTHCYQFSSRRALSDRQRLKDRTLMLVMKSQGCW